MPEAGPTATLLREARRVGDDLKQLSIYEWRMIQRDFARLVRAIVWGLLLGLAGLLLIGIGVPLTLVAGVVVIAQALDWSPAATLLGVGVVIAVFGVTLLIVIRRYLLRGGWFDRSLNELRQIFLRLQAGRAPEGTDSASVSADDFEKGW
jgi:hypothetical protein